MTTNMIRKGLAVGSGVALASTLLVGAPANAAITQINLAPISGSSTGAILGGGFALAATSTGASASDELTFVVEGHDTVTEILAGSAAAQDLLDGNGDPMTAGIAVGSGDANFAGGTELEDESAYAALVDSTTNVATDDSFFFTEGHETDAPYIVAGLGLDASAVDETTTLTVYAFVDGNNNGIFESSVDGAKSNSISITYHAPDEVDYSVSQSLDIEGNTTEISVTPSNVNGASVFEDNTDTTALDELFNTEVFVNGTEDSSNGDLAIGADDWDAADAAFVKTASSLTLSAGDIVTTKVYPGEETTGETTVRTDSGESDVDAYGGIEVANTQLYAKQTDASDPFQTWDLRSGDGQVTVSVRVFDNGTGTSNQEDNVYLEGETVTWELDESASFDSDTVITAGGLTLDEDSISAIKPTSVTDATGTASLTISYADLDDADAFTVDASVVGSGIAGPDTVTFTGRDVTADAYDIVITNVVTGSIARDLNSSITLDLALRDEYGLAPAASAKAKIDVTGGETAVERIVTFPGGSGNTSMTFTDTTSSTASSNTLTVARDGSYLDSKALDFVDSDGDYGTGDQGATLVGQNIINIVDGLSTVNSVDFDTANSHDYEDTNNPLATIDEQLAGSQGSTTYHEGSYPVASVDTRITGGTADLDVAYATGLAGLLTATEETLVVKVTDEDGLGVEGAEVTFANSDFIFADEEKDVFGGGSLAVNTKADGTATVYIASNVSGTHTVTVTSGGQSDDLRVDVAYAHDDFAESIEVTSAATAAPGSTYTFSAMVLDPNGNGVISAGSSDDGNGTLDVSYSGPGLPVGTLPSESTSKGLVSFAILMGANDSGTGTVTLTYTDTDFSPDREVEVEFELTVGDVASTEDVEYGTQKAWTVNQDDGTAKVYVKFPEIDGKLRILHQTGGSGSYDSIYSKTTTSETMDGLRIVEGVGTYVVRTIDLADGTNRIRVSVDGEDIEVNGKDRPARYNE